MKMTGSKLARSTSSKDVFGGHSHCTRFDGDTSELTDILASVTQGSAIGPASFVVTASDLQAYSYYGTLIGTPTPGIQWYKFRPPGVTPNRGMGPP